MPRKGGCRLKRIIAVGILLLFLCGCGVQQSELDPALKLRSKLQTAGCRFDAEITADYGDKTYQFSLNCEADASGNVCFTVLSPETISGITGKIQQGSGSLTFDDTALAFSILADGLASPVSGPWVMLKALRSGYIRSGCMEDGLLRLTVNDSYEQNAQTLDIWLDENCQPIRADVFAENRRILTITVKSFAFV